MILGIGKIDRTIQVSFSLILVFINFIKIIGKDNLIIVNMAFLEQCGCNAGVD